MSATVCYGRQDCHDLHSWGPGIRTCYILHYIIRGKGTFINGGKSYALAAGESFVIRPFDNIAYYPDEKEPWEYTWIEFNGEKYASLLNRIDFARDNCIIGAVDRERIMPLFDIINRISLGTQKNTVNGMASAILGVYADMFENCAKSGENDCFDSARSLIENNFHKPDFDLSAVCGALGISRATLHRCFVRVCGAPPGAYIMKYRLDRAKNFWNAGFRLNQPRFPADFPIRCIFQRSSRLLSAYRRVSTEISEKSAFSE